MKPASLAFIPVGTLAATAALGHLAAVASHSGGSVPPMPTREAVRIYPALLRQARPVALGRLPYAVAEKAALRALRTRAGDSDTPSPAPVCVTWTEDYGRFQVPRRAVYIAKRALLYTQYKNTPPTVYQGVTTAGIDAALGTDTRAPIAAAQTFSFQSMVEMARFNEE